MLTPAQCKALVGLKVRVAFNQNTGNLTVHVPSLRSAVCGDVTSIRLKGVRAHFYKGEYTRMGKREKLTVHIALEGTVVEAGGPAPRRSAAWKAFSYNPTRAPAEFHQPDGTPVRSAAEVHLFGGKPYTPPLALRPSTDGPRPPWDAGGVGLRRGGRAAIGQQQLHVSFSFPEDGDDARN